MATATKTAIKLLSALRLHVASTWAPINIDIQRQAQNDGAAKKWKGKSIAPTNKWKKELIKILRHISKHKVYVANEILLLFSFIWGNDVIYKQ